MLRSPRSSQTFDYPSYAQHYSTVSVITRYAERHTHEHTESNPVKTTCYPTNSRTRQLQEKKGGGKVSKPPGRCDRKLRGFEE